jgi:LysR family transcriptional regulator, glycine cleavage system transcriptional activator
MEVREASGPADILGPNVNQVYSNDIDGIGSLNLTIAEMMQLPSLDALQGFLAAAQTLNFRKAAKLVAVTPAALGQRIKGLEELCGAALFHRTTRSVELTEAGVRMVPVAKAALAAAAECLDVSQDQAAERPVEVVVGTRPDLGMSWLVPQTKALAAELPWLTLHIYFGAGDDLLARLRTREIDCAVTSSRFSDPLLGAFPLHQEGFEFVASPALLARVPFKKPEHAAQHTLIDANPELSLFRAWRDAPGGSHLPFGKVLRYGSLAAILHLVREGRGVAVLPTYFIAPELKRGRVKQLFPRVRALPDFFRLVYRTDDEARFAVYQTLAERLAKVPLA